MTTFNDFINEFEDEARAQGPDAVAELEAFRLHFSLARELNRTIARATGAQLDTVSGWIAGCATPTPDEAERISALASIAERLALLVQPGHIAVWLATANPILSGDAPLDRIAADDHRAVARLVSGLEDPGAS